METLVQDFKYSLRVMAKSPGFLAVALAAIALGIGANTAIFSVVNAVVLRALPYRDPGRLIWATSYTPSQKHNIVFADIFYGWRQQNHAFEDVAAYSADAEFTLTGVGEPVRLHAGQVSENFLPVLGIDPALGRSFDAAEDKPAGPKAVLLSDGLWRSRFSADPQVIGSTVALDGDAYSVIGVLPRGFEFLGNNSVDILVALQMSESSFKFDHGRTSIMFTPVEVVGRLRPGTTLAMAESELNAISKQVLEKLPVKIGWLRGVQARVSFLHDHEVGNVRPALLVLFGAVGFVLLIACANVANLQLARAVVREKEIAVRGALGAGRLRLARLLLTESVTLALAGAIFGLMIASWIIQLIRRFGPGDIPHLAGAQLDLNVLLFTLLIAIFTGVLFGLAPIGAAFRVSIHDTLKESGTRSGTGKGTRLAQKALTVAEVALAVMLFIGAGLLVKSFLRLSNVEPGFNPHGILTARITLPLNVYQSPEQQRALFQRLIERVQGLPEVTSAGAVSTLPLQGAGIVSSVRIEGQPPLDVTSQNFAGTEVHMMTPGAFRALQIPLKEGRLLEERDGADAPPVALVNEAFARRFFPHDDPMGKKVKVALQNITWTVVGVVGDVKQHGMAGEVEPALITPMAQWPSFEMSLVLRTAVAPLSLAADVRREVSELDKNLPVYAVNTMDNFLARDIAGQRFNASALAAFAGLAVLLAAVGIYGVMAYAVGQRTHEIGVRLALGAEPGTVLRLILAQGLRLALAGLALGLAGSLALTRAVHSLLFEIKPADPATFAVVTTSFLAVALIACWVPARRATRVDPVITLRYE